MIKHCLFAKLYYYLKLDLPSCLIKYAKLLLIYEMTKYEGKKNIKS